VEERRIRVIKPRNFDEAQALADCLKGQQLVILNLQQADRDISRRILDFCAGFTYALDGQLQSIASGLFLLTPRNVLVSAKERERLAEGPFFNQL
jgi:cell division inhibitor SepF